MDGVSYVRDGETVLEDVSAVLKGPATCIAGPSGSGKSTLLRLLNRLADPQAGRILYRDRELDSYDVLELRRRVCLVPQLPALIEGTVGENVAFGPQLAGREIPSERIAELLTLAGLDPSFAPRDADRLSVGEQQRVMLARALALEPEVLLLDEPTSALDDEAKAAIEAAVVELTRRLDVSLVVVTHDLEQARRLAQWVVRLSEGRVVSAGTALEVLAR